MLIASADDVGDDIPVEAWKFVTGTLTYTLISFVSLPHVRVIFVLPVFTGVTVRVLSPWLTAVSSIVAILESAIDHEQVSDVLTGLREALMLTGLVPDAI